jgi:tRNA-Thr(GGU) m(6)t(6)A37 methyltransferase TsaA
MAIEFRPIGLIRTPHTTSGDAPIQPSRARGIQGAVEIYDDYVEGLADLDGFSHIILLYHFHQSRGYQVKVKPFLDNRKRGLFSTRSPRRPNPIGLSVVRLVRVEGSTLTIEDVDMLDQTPLLDIKPYVPEFDERPDVRLGWLDAALKR